MWFNDFSNFFFLPTFKLEPSVNWLLNIIWKWLKRCRQNHCWKKIVHISSVQGFLILGVVGVPWVWRNRRRHDWCSVRVKARVNYVDFFIVYFYPIHPLTLLFPRNSRQVEYMYVCGLQPRKPTSPAASLFHFSAHFTLWEWQSRIANCLAAKMFNKGLIGFVTLV